MCVLEREREGEGTEMHTYMRTAQIVFFSEMIIKLKFGACSHSKLKKKGVMCLVIFRRKKETKPSGLLDILQNIYFYNLRGSILKLLN